MAEPLRRRLRSGALRGLTSLAGSLPGGLVAGALGAAATLARFSKHERVTRENLELALGGERSPEELARIARGVRRHAARQLQEWSFLARAARSEAERRRVGAWVADVVELDPSVDLLRRRRAEGLGTIFVTGHLGNWELLAARVRQLGIEGLLVGRRKPNDSSADWLVEMRRGYGLESVDQGVSPRVLLRALERGDSVALLVDLAVPRLAGEPLPFFGRPALTMSAHAALARAARLPLVPVRCVARGRRYLLSVDEPLELDRTLTKEEGRRDLCSRTNAVLERWIREDPEQWAWHQRRWRVTDRP